jgi:hypothetical protein
MTQPVPILLCGRIVGCAVPVDHGMVFTALDPRLDDLTGARVTTAAEALRVAAVVLSRACGGLPTAA